MKSKGFTFAASALVLGLVSLVTLNTIQAQGPMWDRVDVTLPYSVTIGDKTLQPGNYVIAQLESPSGSSQVLLIYGDDGMKFKTMAMTIPSLENRTQPHTRVILNHIGNNYYFDKVWVEGKDYGYEFPLPNSVRREQQAAESVTVAANASSVPATPTQPAAAPATTAVQSDTAMQSDTTTAMQSDTTTAIQSDTTTATTATQTDTSNSANREMTEAPPAPAPAPAAAPAPAPELTPAPDTNEAPAMPHTDAGWLMMLLGGGTLTGLGASLRRKR